MGGWGQVGGRGGFLSGSELLEGRAEGMQLVWIGAGKFGAVESGNETGSK